MPGDGDSRDEYVVARRVLLNALEALRPHLDAITLVGAQAIYLHIGERDDFSTPLYTTDADLTLNPNTLGPEPALIQAMQAADFVLVHAHGVVGTWKSAEDPTVDLLVPQRLGGVGSRAARLPGHGENIARKVIGLEGALVDRSKKSVKALERGDTRNFRVAVAGPMALVVAKLFKIWDRQGKATREDAKDALDLLRILRNVPMRSLAWHLALLRRTATSQGEAETALTYLEELFRDETAYGPQMAAQAAGIQANRDEVLRSSVLLARELLDTARLQQARAAARQARTRSSR